METQDERRELSHVADGPVLLGQEVESCVSVQAVGFYSAAQHGRIKKYVDVCVRLCVGIVAALVTD